MTNAELVKLLRTQDLPCFEEQNFKGMDAFGRPPTRVVCAERHDAAGYSGISFWLSGNDRNWYLGLWSGKLYEVRDLAQLVPIVIDLLSGRWVQRAKTPSSLPPEFITNFGLAPVVFEGDIGECK